MQIEAGTAQQRQSICFRRWLDASRPQLFQEKRIHRMSLRARHFGAQRFAECPPVRLSLPALRLPARRHLDQSRFGGLEFHPRSVCRSEA